MSDMDTSKLKFEDALAELERIVRDLEEGRIDLEESLSRYEQGVALLRRCYGQLRHAEQRILALTGQDEDGNAILKPFAHAPTSAGAADLSAHSGMLASDGKKRGRREESS